MKTDIFDENMFADPTSFNNVNTQTTQELSNLVKQLNDVTQEIAAIESRLKDLRAEKQRLSFLT